jgi:hypothetical protein
MKVKRNRAWRRYQYLLNSGKDSHPKVDYYKPEKKWKFMYFRSNKLKRAQQLGFSYPRTTNNKVISKYTDESEYID